MKREIRRPGRVFVVLDGVRLPISKASVKLGMCANAISVRKHQGWPEEFWTLPKGSKLPAGARINHVEQG